VSSLRAATRLALLAGWLGIALVFHALTRLVRVPSPWPRVFLGGAARLFGARPHLSGVALRRDVVFLANHLSWLDILLLAGASGTAFVAKGELAEVPLIGWLCRLNRTIFVSRGDRMGVARQVEELRAALGEAWAVAIFPEGTTGDGVTLLPFKASLLAALDYGDATRELAWVGDEPGQSHAARVLRRPGRFDAHLAFLAPFDPVGMDRKQIAAEARARIEAALPLGAEAG
jgi:1-acyl-sn-glycerol-3-phosphate acyltransferase